MRTELIQCLAEFRKIAQEVLISIKVIEATQKEILDKLNAK